MPPKRAAAERAEDSVPPEAPAALTPESSESIGERHARLTLALREYRLVAEIEEMERELREGSGPADNARSAGTSPAPEGVGSGIARRAMAPPVFRGASLRELRDFQQSCEVFFDAIEEQSTRRRIALGASYLRDLALREWSRRTVTPDTWESFIRFLRNTIADPVNRMGTASLRLKKAEQRKGQTVREFANYVEELEEDIPEMGIEESRAWVLLNGLRPAIRTGVLRETRTISSRE
jgi:hypothetical protein